MRVCCIEGCKGPNNQDPVYFDFPTSRLHRKRWLDAINAPKLSHDAVICIRHFHCEDYELVRGKTRLKSKVVPSLLIGHQLKNNEDTETTQDSTENAANNKTTHEKITENEATTNNKNSGKVHNDSEKVNNGSEDSEKVNNKKEDDGKVHNDKEDNETVHSDSEKVHKATEENEKISRNKDKVETDSKNAQIDSESCHIDKDNSHNDSGTVNNDSSDNGKEINDSRKPDDDSGKIDSNNIKVDNGLGKTDTYSEKVDNDNGKTDGVGKTVNDIGKSDNDTRNNDNDNGSSNTGKVSDNGKVKSRKTRCKITAMRAVNGRPVSRDSSSSSQDSVSSSPPHKPEMETSKEDIEGILTNYYIENKKTERQVAAMTDVLQEDAGRRDGGETEREERNEREAEWFEPSEPVFIELSVGQGTNSEEAAAANDCLMVLESVQCDVDPALLLAAREDMEIEEVDLAGDDDDDEPQVVRKKEDPISLLTSSDEDDVIIQEPKIDTVEVSSADTSEDDMPLVKLVRSSRTLTAPASKVDSLVKSKRTKNLITKLLWGGTDFYCVHCRFTTVSASEYTKHMATHSKVLQLCSDCGFTTCSRAQMLRHKHKHKNERRFNCQTCNYSAKHKMSLVYHMKTHINNVNEVEVAICDTLEPPSKASKLSEKSEASEKSGKSKASEKSKSAKVKKHNCNSCSYRTNRRSDLKRHRKTHKSDDSEDDEEYVP